MTGLAGTTRPVGATLRVRDLEAQLQLYRDILGLETRERGEGGVTLAPAGEAFSLRLDHVPDATPRPYPCVGLYHVALLVPDRAALAAVILRLRQADWAFEGFADHGVSEAAYLRDPENNGIEIYRDRPRGDWPRDGDGVQMYTEPLDVGALLDVADEAAPLADGTRLGHVHLHVADLDAAEAFYRDGLGLDVTQRSYPGALFFSAGGYHHHVACNTWAGDRRAPEDATGLTRATFEVPDGTVRDVGMRWRDQDLDVEAGGEGAEAVDPAGVAVRVVEAGTSERSP